jgi:hypothetical protein
MENLYSKDEMFNNVYLEQPTDPVPTPAPPSTTSNAKIEPKYLLIGIIAICGLIIIAKKH